MTPAEQAALRAELKKARPKKKAAAKKRRAPRRTTITRRNGRGGSNIQYNMLNGHGDYFSDSVGPLLQHGLPLVLKGLTGFGDYHVQSNSMISRLGGDPLLYEMLEWEDSLYVIGSIYRMCMLLLRLLTMSSISTQGCYQHFHMHLNWLTLLSSMRSEEW